MSPKTDSELLELNPNSLFQQALPLLDGVEGEPMKSGTMRIFRSLTLVAACAVLAVIGFTMGNNKLARTKLDKPLSIQRSDEKVVELKKFSDEPYEGIVQNLVEISPK